MEQIVIEKFGKNLASLFSEKLNEVEASIKNHFWDLKRVSTRVSPEIGASINGEEFIVEVFNWCYMNDEKKVCKLETMVDIRGRFFYINMKVICD
jgi:hypothetical protein